MTKIEILDTKTAMQAVNVARKGFPWLTIRRTPEGRETIGFVGSDKRSPSLELFVEQVGDAREALAFLAENGAAVSARFLRRAQVTDFD